MKYMYRFRCFICASFSISSSITGCSLHPVLYSVCTQVFFKVIIWSEKINTYRHAWEVKEPDYFSSELSPYRKLVKSCYQACKTYCLLECIKSNLKSETRIF